MKYFIKICHFELWEELMLNFVKSHGIWIKKEKIININNEKDKLILKNEDFMIWFWFMKAKFMQEIYEDHISYLKRLLETIWDLAKMTYLKTFDEIMRLLCINSFIQKIKQEGGNNIYLLYIEIMKSTDGKEDFI